MGPFVAHRALLAPHEADDVDRLRQRLQRLSRRTGWASHGGYRFPKRPGSEPELEPAPAEPINRDRSLRQHRRRAQRQAGNVGEDGEPLGAGRHGRQQGEGVHETPLVGVILNPHEIEPLGIGNPDCLPQDVELPGVGDGEDPERRRLAGAGHLRTSVSKRTGVDPNGSTACRAQLRWASALVVCGPAGSGAKRT